MKQARRLLQCGCLLGVPSAKSVLPPCRMRRGHGTLGCVHRANERERAMPRPTVAARARQLVKSCCSLIPALLLTLSCEGALTSTGGETHFLTACDPTLECGDDLACVCGTCVRVCADVSDCLDLPLAECQVPAESAACPEVSGHVRCDVRF